MTTNLENVLVLNSFSLICRGCLVEGCEMKNMFEWGLAEDFRIFSDVSMSHEEGLLAMLCGPCEAALVSCIRFRTRCQRSALILKERGKLSQKQELATPLNTEHELQRIDIDDVLTETGLTITVSTLNMESKIFLPCPYKCKYSVVKQKDLLNHLVKNHEINEKHFTVEVKYNCPIENCSYNKISNKNKHFAGRKFLNQHINKIHRSKDTICDDCFMKFSTDSEYQRHLKVCNVTYMCAICNITYKTNERLLVHLKRKHPDLHEQHKQSRKSSKHDLKRVSETVTREAKKSKKDSVNEYICDSPKRSFATQTFLQESNIRNDVALPSWTLKHERSEELDRNFSTIETQTVFEDLLSLKSQNSEDDSIFFSETVSLSDIQTQTFPIEFGLSRKETITSETQTRNQSPDLSIKETQTCFCLFDSPKVNVKLFDSANSSPSSVKTSTETQTAEFSKSNVKSDVLLSFNSAETQTCFDDNKKSKGL